ncbi:hypothetical protein D3C79_932130 [compost metagenome]
MGLHLGWQLRQLALHARHRQAAFRHPAVFHAHPRAVAGKQLAGDFGLAAPQGTDQAQGIEVSGHGVFSLGSGLTR